MNLLLQYSGTGVILQSSTFQDAVTLGESLSSIRYSIGEYTVPLVVNDTNGVGYLVNLVNDGTSNNFLVFDSSSNNVMTWISNNYATSTLLAFSKTSYTLHI
jgi:hypothetical protein